MRQVYKLEKQRYEVLYHKKKFKRYTDIQKHVIVKDYILNKILKKLLTNIMFQFHQYINL